jgi:predicted glycogen debranching enzyme
MGDGNGMSGELVRRLPWSREMSAAQAPVPYEWLVTNGLGGYASGTVSGIVSRRYHGVLIAALPAPLGRIVLLNQLVERVRTADDRSLPLADRLVEFRLETGLPVWRFELDNGTLIEKRLMMPHEQNTVHVIYSRLRGEDALQLCVRPRVHFRPHEAPVSQTLDSDYVFTALDDERCELTAGPDWPTLRVLARGQRLNFVLAQKITPEVLYPTEESRGYAARGTLWTPGYYRADLAAGSVTFTASAEGWDRVSALPAAGAIAAELERRHRLLETAPQPAREGIGAELVLAADQFIITPAGRVEEIARARAEGDDARTIIAGYHWFTDWGRDTMISLEGLTISTGRLREAGSILRTFAHYVRDGLIPNMFPEGDNEGLYHTADGSLWFFQAIARYLAASGDRSTLRRLLPAVVSIVDRHIESTRFGIGVDPEDGLLRQGADGYQLTWMDAKVDDWVVTPRRGKAVEINALWYNALRLLDEWLREENIPSARNLPGLADQVYESFNREFWFAEGGYLYDVVDAEAGGNDAAFRPNQLLAISLTHPVLQESRWPRVVEAVRDRLLTPVGLRSLAPGHADYKSTYYGDLRTRDAAYHQGTVWAWLIGPYVDAWLKVQPDDRAGARRLLEGFEAHLSEAGIGSISEIFDAEPPFTPRGCIAQAWSVAEVLRCWAKTSDAAARAVEVLSQRRAMIDITS